MNISFPYVNSIAHAAPRISNNDNDGSSNKSITFVNAYYNSETSRVGKDIRKSRVRQN